MVAWWKLQPVEKPSNKSLVAVYLEKAVPLE